MNMKTKALLFTSDDIGCYADGTNGHNHLRDVLADLMLGIGGPASLILALV